MRAIYSLRNYAVRFVRYWITFRKLTLSLVGLVTAICIFPAAHIGYDTSLQQWLDEDVIEAVRYEQRTGLFGDDRDVAVLYRDDDLFSTQSIELVRQLSEELSELEYVESVTSIANIEVTRVTPFGVVQSRLFDQADSDFERAREYLTSDPLYGGNLVSLDGTATLLNIAISETTNEQEQELVSSILNLLSGDPYRDRPFFLVGSLPLITEIDRISQEETSFFSVIAMIVMFSILSILFRSVLVAVLPLFVVGVALTWTMALFALSGNSLNMVTGIVPIVILVIGIADSVHVIHRYRPASPAYEDRQRAAVSALKATFIPCLFTTLTTVVALLSFSTSEIPPLRVFGVYSAIGSLLCFVMSMTLLPPLLCSLPNRVYQASDNGLRWVDSLTNGVRHLILRSAGATLLVSALVLVVALVGVSRINFVSDQVNYLRSNNSIRLGIENLQQWFGGSYPIELILSSSEEGHFFKPENIRRLDLIGAEISSAEEVRSMISAATILKSTQRIGMQVDSTLGWSEGLNESYVRDFFERLQVGRPRYVSEDGSTARILIRTRWLMNEELDPVISRLQTRLQSISETAGLSWFFTGVSMMYAQINNEAVVSQISSIVTCFVAIFIMLAILFRRLNIALAGMIPNVLPVLTTLGVMGWLGVRLDAATVLIAAISLGIAVDDTIQFLWAYQNNRRGGGGGEGDALLESIYTAVGRPIVITTVLLLAGFIVMIGSSFLPVAYFGAFLGLNILLALVFDFLLLPTVLKLSDLK